MDNEGNIVDMGSGSDEMHAHSYRYHPALPLQIQRHRLLLNAIMFAGGLRH